MSQGPAIAAPGPSCGLSLLLASASPRRKELLTAAGLRFEVCPADVEETFADGEFPEAAARRLAQAKAAKAGMDHPHALVLAADTVVAVSEGNDGHKWAILGKPGDPAEAALMLRKLQGREHQVATAFCLCCKNRGLELTRCCTAGVRFRSLTEDEISAYVATGEPMGKAGAYAVQGIGRALIASITGSYTSIMGLPLAEVVEELSRIGAWNPRMLVETAKEQAADLG